MMNAITASPLERAFLLYIHEFWGSYSSNINSTDDGDVLLLY